MDIPKLKLLIKVGDNYVVSELCQYSLIIEASLINDFQYPFNSLYTLVQTIDDINELFIILKHYIIYVSSCDGLTRYVVSHDRLRSNLGESNYITKFYDYDTKSSLKLCDIVNRLSMNNLMSLGFVATTFSMYTKLIPLFIKWNIVKCVSVSNVYLFNPVQWFLTQHDNENLLSLSIYDKFVSWRNNILRLTTDFGVLHKKLYDTNPSCYQDFISMFKVYENSGLDIYYKMCVPSSKHEWILLPKCNESHYLITLSPEIQKAPTFTEYDKRDDILSDSDDKKKYTKTKVNKEFTRQNSKSSIDDLRDVVWYTWCVTSAVCFTCNQEITKDSWECSHILAASKGGAYTLQNLRPLCSTCNGRMKARHMYRYIIYKNLPSKEKLPKDDPYVQDSVRKYKIIKPLLEKIHKLKIVGKINKGDYRYLKKKLTEDYGLNEDKIFDNVVKYIENLYDIKTK